MSGFKKENKILLNLFNAHFFPTVFVKKVLVRKLYADILLNFYQ